MVLLDSGARWWAAECYNTSGKCSRTPEPKVPRIMKDMRGGNWHLSLARRADSLPHYPFLLDLVLGMCRLCPTPRNQELRGLRTPDFLESHSKDTVFLLGLGRTCVCSKACVCSWYSTGSIPSACECPGSC